MPERRAPSKEDESTIDEFLAGMNSKPALFRAFKDTVDHDGEQQQSEHPIKGCPVVLNEPGRRKRHGVVEKINRDGSYDIKLDPPPMTKSQREKRQKGGEEKRFARGVKRDYVKE